MSYNKKKTVLITGGAGFIGSFMCNRLVAEGFSLIILDNLFRGSLDNIKNLLTDKNLFINIDIANNNSINVIADIIDKYKPELIMHYAAINGTQYFYDEPAKVAVVNSIATYNLMESIKKIVVKNKKYLPLIYFSSTSEVYGEPFNIPTKETDITYTRVYEDRDSYAAAKLMSEFYVKLLSKEIKIPFLITRIFNVYGPRMVGTKYGQVIPEFITRLLNKEYPLKIIGDGSHSRSFCYIDDHIDLTMKLLKSGLKNEVVNLGNPNEISIKELAKTIMIIMDKEPKFKYRPARKGDHMRRCPDIRKLTKVVGDYGFTTLEDGIKQTIDYYKDNLLNG